MTKLRWPDKDPDEVLDFAIDWSARLGEQPPAGDTIASSEWIVPDGLTKTSEITLLTETTIWLSGGVLGATYGVTNRVVTSGGRTLDQTVYIRIRSR